ncbi:hypothetical protein ABZU32_13780 [Sphaerisporangium sp. NPDC005288]|uniref:hypothetical protein n=1 Tax=Sphaerisporangium sp. NPDC005288 TaxID=3155114 RepID=UPI0033B6278A
MIDLSSLPSRALAPGEPLPYTPEVRRKRARLLLLTFFVLPSLVVIVGIVSGAGQGIKTPMTVVVLIACVVPSLFLVVCAPKGAYRRRDLLILGNRKTCRLLWRIAYLPYRDWPPRPDEIRRMERVVIPGSDMLVYRYRTISAQERLEDPGTK